MSKNQKLIISMGRQKQNVKYKVDLGLISYTFQQLGANIIKINYQMMKFVAYSILVNANPEYI
jgi:hypothetical protein